MAEQEIFRRFAEEMHEQQGFIQQSPVRVGVWLALLGQVLDPVQDQEGDSAAQAQEPHTVDVLLTPVRHASAIALATAVNDAIQHRDDLPWCAFNQTVVAGTFDFETLITRVLRLAARGGDQVARGRVYHDLTQSRAGGRSSG